MIWQLRVMSKWGPKASMVKYDGIYRVEVGRRRIVLGEGSTPREAFEDACSR